MAHPRARDMSVEREEGGEQVLAVRLSRQRGIGVGAMHTGNCRRVGRNTALLSLDQRHRVGSRASANQAK